MPSRFQTNAYFLMDLCPDSLWRPADSYVILKGFKCDEKNLYCVM